MHWLGDVLELLRAGIGEGSSDAAPGMLAHRRRDADPAGLGERLQPCRNIDCVAEPRCETACPGRQAKPRSPCRPPPGSPMHRKARRRHSGTRPTPRPPPCWRCGRDIPRSSPQRPPGTGSVRQACCPHPPASVGCIRRRRLQGSSSAAVLSAPPSRPPRAEPSGSRAHRGDPIRSVRAIELGDH